MSQITTHVLNTSKGRPAQGITIKLQEYKDQQWFTIGEGITNSDGRVSDLLNGDTLLDPGSYRMHFQLKSYFEQTGDPCFYPEANIIFNIADDQHYHIPLLLSPFGYSTYKGS
ncbi:MAG: hydroxyisourate hydrolase [Cyclobacteriaceae bacterium]|nr:hydroxyisourate hydrolase [Cyclobacteriaceae bacterium]